MLNPKKLILYVYNLEYHKLFLHKLTSYYEAIPSNKLQKKIFLI